MEIQAPVCIENYASIAGASAESFPSGRLESETAGLCYGSGFGSGRGRSKVVFSS